MLEIDLGKRLDGPDGAFDLDVKLQVNAGEIVALYGPSGAGKTSVLRMVAGLLQPERGQLTFAGESWLKKPPGQRNAGFVFQDYALFPNMTVLENLAFASGGKPDLPAVFALGDLRHKYPHQLSGGQRQRVAVARALVQSPDVLLLDEPLSALDQRLRRQIGTHLKQAVEERAITTLLVSHDLDEVLSLANRVAVMEAGRVVSMGAPAELLLAPAKDGLVEATVLEVAADKLLVRIHHQRVWVTAPPGAHRSGDTIRLSVN